MAGELGKIKQIWRCWSRGPWAAFAYVFFGVALILTWTVEAYREPVPDIADRIPGIENLDDISTAAGPGAEKQDSFKKPDFE